MFIVHNVIISDDSDEITLPGVEEGSPTKDVEPHEYQGNLMIIKMIIMMMIFTIMLIIMMIIVIISIMIIITIIINDDSS